MRIRIGGRFWNVNVDHEDSKESDEVDIFKKEARYRTIQEDWSV